MRVLIVKLSSLGDVIHTMPAVMDLRQRMPQVQIDWVVERSFAPLVQCCTAVQQVIPCDLRRWRRTPWSAQTRREWAAFRQALQTQAYDRVVDLQGLSKSALVSWLARLTPAGERHAMARRTEGSGYEAPTRWVADVAPSASWPFPSVGAPSSCDGGSWEGVSDMARHSLWERVCQRSHKARARGVTLAAAS